MNITDRAGFSGFNVMGAVSRAYHSVVRALTVVEEVAIAHQRYKKLVAAGMEPADAAAQVFDQVAGRTPKTPRGKPAKVVAAREMQLAA